MKVLMFGWEFPPFNSGGLGTACYGLTKALSRNKVEVTFVLPRTEEVKSEFVKLIPAEDSSLTMVEIDSPLIGYVSSKEYQSERHALGGHRSIYGKNLFAEVERYARKAASIAAKYKHDIIHAHDWLTYKAALKAKEVSGKPLVVHVHATEFDRTGGNGVHQYVYEIEKEGMRKADAIIAVSNYTKKKIVEHYGINPHKITVVHNGVDLNKTHFDNTKQGLFNHKVVLFLGRITLQKGPDYFLYAAKKILDYNRNVAFVIAGNGDMQPFLMEKAAELGIADKVLFTGFLRGEDIDKAYQMADVYVMPSVSEPFGIAPLEAIRNGTPAIISKQSGVSEVLTHCLKVDFWDVHELANKIIGVLEYKELQQELRENSAKELPKFDWDGPAQRCTELYTKLTKT